MLIEKIIEFRAFFLVFAHVPWSFLNFNFSMAYYTRNRHPGPKIKRSHIETTRDACDSDERRKVQRLTATIGKEIISVRISLACPSFRYRPPDAEWNRQQLAACRPELEAVEA